MPLAYNVTVASRFSLRYFLDDSLSGTTRFVMWFPDNQGDKYTGSAAAIDRNNLPINVYDADEVAISSLISLPDELNYIDAKTIDGTINDPTGHAITDLASANRRSIRALCCSRSPIMLGLPRKGLFPVRGFLSV